MSKIQTFIKKHPLPIYFILTFVTSWGSVLLVIGGPGKILITREQIETLLPIVILTMLTGPTVAGLLLTGLIEGRAGFRELRSRLSVAGRYSLVCWCAPGRTTDRGNDSSHTSTLLPGVSPRHTRIR